MLEPRGLAFVVSHERKDSGDENNCGFGTRTSFLGGPRRPPEVVSARLDFFGTRAEKCAFSQQKSSGSCPILLARVPKYRSAVPKMNGV